MSNLKMLNELKLSVEEIFMNMVRHNKTTTKDIAIRIESYKNICISLIDHEDNPFDILKQMKLILMSILNKKNMAALNSSHQALDDLIFDHDAGKTTIKITKHIN